MNRHQRRLSMKQPQRIDIRAEFERAKELHLAGYVFEAEERYREILAVDPKHGPTLALLGMLAEQMGEFGDAALLLRKAIAANPEIAVYHSSLASALNKLGQLDDAIDSYKRAFKLQPEGIEPLVNIGLVLMKQNKPKEALAWYQAAAEISPDSIEAINNIGTACQYSGEVGRAISAYRRVVALRPTESLGYHNLGTALADGGQLDEATWCIEESIRICPDHASTVGAALVFGKLYKPGVTLKEVFETSCAFEKTLLHEPSPQRSFPEISAPPRVGFVSGDLRRHAVGMLVVGALEGLARRGHKLTVYSTFDYKDDLTFRILKVADWRMIQYATDEEAMECIRNDKIDILVDLSGYTGHNRLSLFTKRSAPIQVFGWLGYPATSGLSCMDYYLADRYQIPPGSEKYYREKVVILPDNYMCFSPPEDSPKVTARDPAQPITFGSFNVLKKINPGVVALWSRVLREIPQSRMLIKANGLGCKITQQYYLDLFASHGVSAGRIDLMGGTSQAEHMEAMLKTDIVLDTFPYSGGQTTLECLWMGIPVVTLPGETFASRHSLGYLSAVGLEDLAAGSPDSYVGAAVRLAMSKDRLMILRHGLRDIILASTLADVDRFAVNLENAFNSMVIK